MAEFEWGEIDDLSPGEEDRLIEEALVEADKGPTYSTDEVREIVTAWLSKYATPQER
jgi:hypothetical protein